MKTLWMIALVLLLGSAGMASDWPQFMCNGAHTGDAADEILTLPLGLVAQVKLDDAVMTSPAVVGGLIYVVDQMGTAYCVDPRAGRIVWKVSPDGDKAMGSNTSSPCVAKGRMYYGTTAGNVHILDCKDGKTIKTVNVGWPIPASLTLANDSIYFQALDAVVRCLDLDGNEKWTWDHYKRYKEPPEITKAEERRRQAAAFLYERSRYGGGEVPVSGTKVVTSAGWDIFCLEDRGKSAELAWCRRCPNGLDGTVPMSSSICGEWVYTAGMGADGVVGWMRCALKDGTSAKGGVAGVPSPWSTPAARGSTVTTCGSSGKSFYLYDCESGKTSSAWQNGNALIPVIGSPALARDHCVIATLNGELAVFEITPKPDAKPQCIETPHGKGIGSSPAVSGGCMYFGCDDGYLYVYGPGGVLQPQREEKLSVHEPRNKIGPATGRAYGWPSACGNAANTNFVDDPDLKPPLKLRWAARSYGHFKTPCVATAEGEVISVTLQRTVTCLEQATGRMRWRMRLPPAKGVPAQDGWESAAGLLVAGGRVYVPCPHQLPGGKLLCLDVRDGRILWTAEIGARNMWSRAGPLAAGGKVIFSHLGKGTPPVAVVQAWEAGTGKEAWQVPLNVISAVGERADGCGAGEVVYFSTGTEEKLKPEGDRKHGETVAIDVITGKVLWRNTEVFVHSTGAACPLLASDRLLLPGCYTLRCISVKDGSLLWTSGGGATRYSIGPDFMVSRAYGGVGTKLRLKDGVQDNGGLQQGGQLGSDTHACSPVALTPNCSFASGAGGLDVRDVRTGALLWRSLGFAPRGCVNPVLANGRVFYPGAADGMLYCWEPEAAAGK